MKSNIRLRFQMIQLDDAPDRDDGWQREETAAMRRYWAFSLRRGGGCVVGRTAKYESHPKTWNRFTE